MKLGIREYCEILDLQRLMNTARIQNIIPDTVIFLEHYPCITIGNRGKHKHILVSRKALKDKGIQVYKADRGGDVTYHGPGQLICYPIIDLGNHNSDVFAYARNLEEVVIRTLHAFKIFSSRKKGHPGVWLGNNKKIAAQGITVTRNVTMHGISLNVCPEMAHFSLIIPCGLFGYEVISMEEYLGHPPDISKVISKMRAHFQEIFNIKLEEVTEDTILEMTQCKRSNTQIG